MDTKEVELLMKKVSGLCICQGCPTYISCGELAFCFQTVGRSKCIKKEADCICPGCPNSKKYKLQNIFYCIRGSEKSMTGGKNFTF